MQDQVAVRVTFFIWQDLAAKRARPEFATGATQHMLNPASARLYAAGWALLSHEEKPASSLALTRALLLACRSSGDVRLVAIGRTHASGLELAVELWRCAVHPDTTPHGRAQRLM